MKICYICANEEKMIVEFSVKNFRSIKELQTISFVASSLDSNSEKYPELDTNNIVQAGETRLLKTVGIYGANASGKSNIIRGFDAFVQFIAAPPSAESRLGDLTDPFLFQAGSRESESYFQVILLIQGKKYRYGFTARKAQGDIDPVDAAEVVTSEWLYGPKEKNQVKYFTRTGMSVARHSLPGAENVPPLPYAHGLFLTHAAGFADGICAEIQTYLRKFVVSNVRAENPIYRFHSINMVNDPLRRRSLLDFLSYFDIEYSDIRFDRDFEQSDLRKVTLENIVPIRQLPQSPAIELNLKKTESQGTIKLFELAGLLIRAFDGSDSGLIMLDEIDSNFHPKLLIKLIELFNTPTINKSGTQLLFTSHDTNLLNPALMRRDQVYFAEKDLAGGTMLYSLANLKGVRNDADFARQYLAGIYGALPVLHESLQAIPFNHG